MDLIIITVGERTGMAAVVGNTTSQSTAIAAGAPIARRARRARIVGRMVTVAGLRRTAGDGMRGTGVAGMKRGTGMNEDRTDMIGMMRGGGVMSGGMTGGGMKSEEPGMTGGRIEAFYSSL